MRYNIPLFCALAVFMVVEHSRAAVYEFTDKQDWQSAIAGYQTTTIPFTGFTAGTVITNQYEAFGILFSDGNDIIVSGSPFNDGWGLRGGVSPDGSVSLAFLSPQYAIGIDYPGAAQFELYQQGHLIHTSTAFGGVGGPFFAAIVSTQPFDHVRIVDWFDTVLFIDDLHFGVPAPGSLALLGLAALWPGARRRRSQ